MRIVFIGSVLFSLKSLQKLIELNANIVAIITKKHSSYNTDFEDLSFIAMDKGIPFKYVNDINHPNNVSWIKEFEPDVVFCFGWSSLIKKDLLSVAPMGVVGFHPAMLPKNRGRHPIIWAKILGLSSTGSSFFFMDEGADSGAILDQRMIEISFEDDACSLYNKIIKVAIDQIETFIPKLQTRSYEYVLQEGVTNTWRKRTASDGRIDFRMSSKNICNLVRGLSKPYSGAHCVFEGREIKVWGIELGNNTESNLEPGKVIGIEQNIIEVKSGDGSVCLTSHDFDFLPELNSYFL